MRQIRKQLMFVCAALAVFLGSCGRGPSEPSGIDVRFGLAFEYGEIPEQSLFYGPFMDGRGTDKTTLEKTNAEAAVDLVQVLVADLSAYGSVSEYMQSDEYAAYLEDAAAWVGNLRDWGEWVKLIGDHFQIVSNQKLTIESNQASGTVGGVIGLNYIGVAMLENGKIQFWGEGQAMGVQGETSHASISVHRIQGDLQVDITYPHEGDALNTRTTSVSGTVSDTSITTATMTVNDNSQSIAVVNGYFSNPVILTRGTNRIRVAVEREGNTAFDEVTIQCTAPLIDIRVTLTWNTIGTDLDLYVTDPNGETDYYSHNSSAIGGTLDVDDIDGYGPENFTLDQGEAIPGDYSVQIRYYSGVLPSRATVIVLLHESQTNESVTTYGEHEFASGGSSPWDVVTIHWP
jgi:uncharacterized protein YfaP (DUF2135 family)